MKKIALIAMIFLGFGSLKAQNESGKWSFGATVSVIDFSGPQTKQFFNLKKYRGNQRYFVGRYLNPSFNIKGDFTFGKVWFPKVSAFPNVVENIYENRHMYDFGVNVEYKLNNGYILKEKAIVAPYLFTGLGFNTIIDYGKAKGTDINTYIPFGVGVTVRATNWLSFNLQTAYKLNLDNSFDYTQHTAGIVLNFGGKPKGGTAKDIATDLIDSDGDGIIDLLDECPFAAGPESMFGCPDTDGDGIGDSRDDCPTVAGTLINRGCPAKDSDGDGVPDDQDSCPNEFGEKRYAGCPDTDGDGIVDKYDKCPNEAGPASNNGCPETSSKSEIVVPNVNAAKSAAAVEVATPAANVTTTTTTVTTQKTTPVVEVTAPAVSVSTPAVTETKAKVEVTAPKVEVTTEAPKVSTSAPNISTSRNVNTTFSTTNTVSTSSSTNLGILVERTTIYFGSASDVVPTAERAKLANVIELLKENPSYRALIKGFTDEVGDEASNLDLSIKRATTVWQYLSNNGMQGNRAEIYGFGKMAQEAETQEGNRRVVIEIIK